jgi:hypothetical protein
LHTINAWKINATQESAEIFRLYLVNITGSGGYPAKSRNINQ